MHEHYLQQAIDLAIQNVGNGLGGPYGAVIVKDGKVIAASTNQVTSKKDPTAHAEMMAIRLACEQLDDFQLSGCILYSSCEPCPMCLGAIYWARLESVYYACNRQDAAAANFDDRDIYDEIAIPPAQRRIPMRYIALPQALAPFTAWRQKSDKILY